jgi:hypothetical protein
VPNPNPATSQPCHIPTYHTDTQNPLAVQPEIIRAPPRSCACAAKRGDKVSGTVSQQRAPNCRGACPPLLPRDRIESPEAWFSLQDMTEVLERCEAARPALDATTAEILDAFREEVRLTLRFTPPMPGL